MTSPSTTGGSPPCSASRSRSTRASWSASSATTAPASRRRSGRSPASFKPTSGTDHVRREVDRRRLARRDPADGHRARAREPPHLRPAHGGREPPASAPPRARIAGRPSRTSSGCASAFRCSGSSSTGRARSSPAASSSSSRSPARCSSRPKLLLLDEPTLGLAPLIVDQVFEILAGAPRGGRDDPPRRAERGAHDRGRRPHVRDAQRRAYRVPRQRRRSWPSVGDFETAYIGMAAEHVDPVATVDPVRPSTRSPTAASSR